MNRNSGATWSLIAAVAMLGVVIWLGVQGPSPR
jgi:hypothetical protein